MTIHDFSILHRDFVREWQKTMNKNEQLAINDNITNAPVLVKLRDRLSAKSRQLEILKIEVKQLRELITSLEKESRK